MQGEERKLLPETCVNESKQKKLLASKYKHSNDAKLNILLLPADRKYAHFTAFTLEPSVFSIHD